MDTGIKNIAKQLNLDKPLIIFDIETTGPAISIDRIIDLAYMKIMPNGRIIKGHYQFNPEIEISKESIEIHGIMDDDLIAKPTFKKKSDELWDLCNNCYYGGYNIVNFDLPVLRREFLRAGMDFNYTTGSVIDSRLILEYMEPRTLSYAYKFYCNKNHQDNEDFLSDVEASAEILTKQLKKYDIIKDIKFINNMHREQDDDKVYSNKTIRFFWRKGIAYFAFSKYRNRALPEIAKIDLDFMNWILESDFADDLKHIVSKTISNLNTKKKISAKKT